MKTSASTGHFAMSQTATAVLPRPTTSPTVSASGPVTTTATAHSASSRTMTIVMPSCSGRTFQNGRPSGIS